MKTVRCRLTLLIPVCTGLTGAVNANDTMPPASARPRIEAPAASTELEILRQDVARCFGTTWRGGQNVDALNAEGQALEAEVATLNASSEALAAQRATIEAGDAELDSGAAALQAESAALTETGKRIDAAKAGPVRTQADVERINRMIRDYNERVTRQNAQAEALKARAEARSAQVARHNEALGHIDARAQALRARIARHEARSTAIANELREFNEKCSGQRRIVDPDQAIRDSKEADGNPAAR